MKKSVLFLSAATLLLSVFACTEKEDNATVNPAAFLTDNEQKAMVGTLKDIADGHLYSMDYTADYKLNELMASGGAKSNTELTLKILGSLLDIPSTKADAGLDFGCSAFCVKSPEGDVLVGRNFDYRFVSSANVLVHNKACREHESFCISSLPYLDKDVYVAGSLSDGKTDVSIPAVASIYCCLDGMNDAGLFICVLSLREGGAWQDDPTKGNIMPSTAMRIALDSCTTVNQAVEVFRNHNFYADGKTSEANYHFLIADASGKAAVVEYIRPENDWVMNVVNADHVTNFYLSEGWQHIGVGQARYDSLHTTLERKNRIMTMDECMDLLDVVHTDLNSEGGEITSNTQWSVVYNLTKKTGIVCVEKDYSNRIPFSL